MLGDLSAQVEKLKAQLRLLRFPIKDFMEQGVLTGKPIALLPILHFVFFSFSKPFAGFVRERGYELYAKSDLRFIEECYQVLRKELHYRPTLSTAQFFQNGFVERKVMLLQDVIRVVRRWHNEQVGQARDALSGSTLSVRTAMTTPKMNRTGPLMVQSQAAAASRPPIGASLSTGATSSSAAQQGASLAEVMLRRGSDSSDHASRQMRVLTADGDMMMSGTTQEQEDGIIASTGNYGPIVVTAVSPAKSANEVFRDFCAVEAMTEQSPLLTEKSASDPLAGVHIQAKPAVSNSMELDFTLPPPQPMTLAHEEPTPTHYNDVVTTAAHVVHMGGNSSSSRNHGSSGSTAGRASNPWGRETNHNYLQEQREQEFVEEEEHLVHTTRDPYVFGNNAVAAYTMSSSSSSAAHARQVPVSAMASGAAGVGLQDYVMHKFEEMAKTLEALSARVTVLEMERKLDQSRQLAIGNHHTSGAAAPAPSSSSGVLVAHNNLPPRSPAQHAVPTFVKDRSMTNPAVISANTIRDLPHIGAGQEVLTDARAGRDFLTQTAPPVASFQEDPPFSTTIRTTTNPSTSSSTTRASVFTKKHNFLAPAQEGSKTIVTPPPGVESKSTAASGSPAEQDFLVHARYDNTSSFNPPVRESAASASERGGEYNLGAARINGDSSSSEYNFGNMASSRSRSTTLTSQHQVAVHTPTSTTQVVVGGVAIPSAEETQKLIANLTAKFKDTQELLEKAKARTRESSSASKHATGAGSSR
ncbi:unnamed protein product [Amoebophrya sp. A120]|nr:unnamed protein product [Amoebophrya sp. A120]|eukprot:GSA120T00005117001.1